jgi:hypothetical protein
MPLYFKNGKKKIIDVFNFEKLLSDFMAKKMPYTDRERVP